MDGEHTERVDWIDALKGFAILLVIVGHLIQTNYQSGIGNTIFNIIYSFHMPLFFFLSGFMVGFKDNGKLPFSFIKKKMATLLLPWLSWTMISACYLGGGVITASI